MMMIFKSIISFLVLVLLAPVTMAQESQPAAAREGGRYKSLTAALTATAPATVFVAVEPNPAVSEGGGYFSHSRSGSRRGRGGFMMVGVDGRVSGNNGAVYSPANPAAVLEDELRSELEGLVLFQGAEPARSSEEAGYILEARYSIADEDLSDKGFGGNGGGYGGGYGIGGLGRRYPYAVGRGGSVWEWLALGAGSIYTHESRRKVQGVLHLRLRDQDNRTLYYGKGIGELDSREVKAKIIGPYYRTQVRHPNAHFLAVKMVDAASGETVAERVERKEKMVQELERDAPLYERERELDAILAGRGK